ncbi:hypothetical protein [Bacillus sp. MMSF_3328]|uniref:hypothetical protein n=1 Tax=Bacillus sp. MMSF_3328 TaxID=3047080 RepID=UPI00273D1D4B|nr:hypothetical protein [Bacillus sp. MMSF_3328]
MFKKGIAALFSMILLLSVTLVDTNNVQAGYTDNPSRLYFDLSQEAYRGAVPAFVQPGAK